MVTKQLYGTTSTGQPVYSYLLTNARNTQILLIEYGCRIVKWMVPNREGKATDIVLGCGDLAGYEKDSFFLGSFVGRFANRIEKAQFELDGKTYTLSANNGPNHNHGVWHQKVFAGHILPENGVEFCYTSPDGEDGFPGNVEVSVRCILTEENQLILDYTATSDGATPINLTNHSYFNLDGPESESVLNHQLQLWADHYTPSDANSCPFGTVEPVTGTPMDFSTLHTIGEQIDQPFQQLEWGKGYDHNYVVNRTEEKPLAKAAYLKGEKSGIWLECYTTQPGMQLYTANWLQEEGISKEGFTHGARKAVCLETQNFPCAPNRPQFPNSILCPGKLLRQTTMYAFGCEN